MDARITRNPDPNPTGDPSRAPLHAYEKVNAAGILVRRRKSRNKQAYTSAMHIVMSGPPSTYIPPKEK